MYSLNVFAALLLLELTQAPLPRLADVEAKSTGKKPEPDPAPAPGSTTPKKKRFWIF